MYQCNDCESFIIALEAIVLQDAKGGTEISVICDKGHVCDECGSRDVVVVEREVSA